MANLIFPFLQTHFYGRSLNFKMLFWLWPAVLPHRFFFGYPALCAVAASYVKRGIKTLKKKEKEKEKRQEEEQEKLL